MDFFNTVTLLTHFRGIFTPFPYKIFKTEIINGLPKQNMFILYILFRIIKFNGWLNIFFRVHQIIPLPEKSTSRQNSSYCFPTTFHKTLFLSVSYSVPQLHSLVFSLLIYVAIFLLFTILRIRNI